MSINAFFKGISGTGHLIHIRDWLFDPTYHLSCPRDSLLDFGALSTNDFKSVGKIEAINLFSNENFLKSLGNPDLMTTVYALGRVNMRLVDRDKGLVEIINDDATDYDWNRGGGSKRDWFIRINNFIVGIDPAIHGFKTYYYGYGVLNQ